MYNIYMDISLLFNLFLYISTFIFGLIVGSFLNCIIYRLNVDESFLKGRSFCPHCRHALSWKDLIPLLSFLSLKGKCRYCKKKISWQYPAIELATGSLFLLIFVLRSPIFNLLNFLSFLYLIVISCFLIIIFVYDLRHYLILDKVIYPAIAVTLIYHIFGLESFIFNFLPAAVGATLFFLAIYLISKGKWLGFGDVKLAFFLGLLVGFPNILLALFLSFFIGAIIGVGLIVLKGKNLKTEVPFAPFLVIGTFLALFWGDTIINWYLSLIIY